MGNEGIIPVALDHLHHQFWVHKTDGRKPGTFLRCGNFTWEETVYATIEAATRVVSFPGCCKCWKADCGYYHVTYLYDYPGVETLVGNEFGRLADFEHTAKKTHQLILGNISIPTMQFRGWSFTCLCSKALCSKLTQLCYFKRDRPPHRLEKKSREWTGVWK